MPNTYDPALLTDFLQPGTITKLQNRLAPLAAFTTKFEPNPVSPKSTCQLKVATSGASTQTNPTNFENGDSVVSNVEIAVDILSHDFHVSNEERQQGLTMQDIIPINAAAFADKVMRVVTAPITSANFPATPLISSAGAFNWSDMTTLLAALAKSEIRNVILDPTYFVRIMNQPGYLQQVDVAPGRGFKKFGWDYVGENTEWSGAEAHTKGFACNPQALGVVAGLPLLGKGANLERMEIELPSMLGGKCYFCRWINTQTRDEWCSFDIAIGAAPVDETAGILIKNG